MFSLINILKTDNYRSERSRWYREKYDTDDHDDNINHPLDIISTRDIPITDSCHSGNYKVETSWV